mgnify:CR=1 FL=1
MRLPSCVFPSGRTRGWFGRSRRIAGGRDVVEGLDAVADGLADQSGRGPEGLEYQFFLGADPDLQLRTADAGHRVRILVPYGPMWLEHLHDLARRPSGIRRLVETLTDRG